MTVEMVAVLFGVFGAAAAALGIWFGRNPACPTCGSRSWNRKLCYPLLLCRRCAQRIDRSGHKRN